MAIPTICKRPRPQRRGIISLFTVVVALSSSIAHAQEVPTVVDETAVDGAKTKHSQETPTAADETETTQEVPTAADEAKTKQAEAEAIDETLDYGNHNQNWEDGTASWEEFGHDNAPDICGLRHITTREWEAKKWWGKDEPVIVTGVTDGWAALENWKLQEMLRLYPDAEATMGDGRRVGEIGPDAAGNLLTATTVRVS